MVLDPQWLSGFIEAEGCFYVCKENSSTKYKLGTTVRAKLYITQHSRDAYLLKNIAKFLGCGKYYLRKGSLIADFQVTGFKNIYEKFYLYWIIILLLVINKKIIPILNQFWS